MDDRGFILDTDATAQDVYSKLNSEEIRTLLLAPGQKPSPIICEMQVVPRPSSLQYEALSYVWGDTAKVKSISCNGFDFAVTESLFSALLHLRYRDSWRRIWVDQLCINQTAAPELMAQVSLMDKVYSCASRVIVWLGDCDQKMAQAWQLLQETALSTSLVRSDFLSSSPSPTPRKRPKTRRRLSGSSTRSTLSSQTASSSRESLSSSLCSSSPRAGGRRAVSSPALKHALAIFQHVWFRRKWTFQEIILAKAAIICSGDLEMAWSDLTTWYFHYASKLRSSSLLYDSQGSFENIMTVRNELDKGEVKLSSLLMLTRQRQSTKPEDAVYALLGLLPDLGHHLHTAGGAAPAKWTSETLLELYFAAFRYCLANENSLSILSAAGMYKGNSSTAFPTWLPDWREQLPLRPLVLVADQAGLEQYSAAGDTTPQYSWKASLFRNNILTVRGFRVGCVCTRQGFWPSTFLVADSTAQKVLDEKGEGAKFSQSITTLPVPAARSSRSPPTYAKRLFQAALQKKITCAPIRTSAMVETGDWLCLLLGGPVLYALSPVTEPMRSGAASLQQKEVVQCRFIGECSVNGLMRGELVSFEDEIEYLEFELI